MSKDRENIDELPYGITSKEVSDAEEANQQVIDQFEEYRSNNEMITPEEAVAPLLKDSFWEKARDFVMGRTKAGQIFHTIAGAGIGIATGVNADPILSIAHEPVISTTSQIIGGSTMDMNWIELGLMALSAVITFVTARGVVKGFLNELLLEIEDIVSTVKQAREADSEAGKEYSPAEREQIEKEINDAVMLLYKRFVRSWIARLFGLNAKKRNQ